MINLTESNYPFYSYIPSRYAAGILSIIVYISTVLWFAQSMYVQCRPRLLAIFLFLSHLTTFIGLVLRATLNIDILNTRTLYSITAPLLNLSPRFLLLANYHCLVELRGKQPRRILDRVIEIILPFGAITAAVLLGTANQFSFNPNRLDLSFRLRQISAGLILGLALFFYVVWHFAVSHARRLYVLPLLAVSSSCVLIEAIYIQILSIPSLFSAQNQNEVWFYAFHLVPIVFTLITWSIFHPWRLLPPPEIAVPHDETGKELLPPPSSV
jgi:hypothetical protein